VQNRDKEGGRIMKVRECMSNKISYVSPDTTASDVAKLMMDEHIGCVPVCDTNKRIVGLVTDRDLILRTIACDKDVKQTPVSEIMTTTVYTAAPDSEVSEAKKIMSEWQIKRVPVVQNEEIIGIITVGDLANSTNVDTTEVGTAVEGICRCGANAKNAE